MIRASLGRTSVALLLVGTLVGCRQRHALAPGTPAGLPAPLEREISLARQAGPDTGLHAMQASSLSLWYGDAALAGQHLDQAIAGIELIYAGTDNAAVKARELYHAEKEKPFKGEPYERMMAYVYRGLLDYGAHDYSNAAASFRAAILQDAFADEQQNRCDFEAAEYLLARSILMEGGDARLSREAFGRAGELAKLHHTTLPPLSRDHNVLLVVEVGPAPFKVAQGESDELLVIGRRGADGMRAEVGIDDARPVRTTETANLAYQALTRGGRQFDFILAGKAYPKEVTRKSGVTINQVGTALSVAVPMVGAPIQLVGLGVKAAGIGIKAQADKRYWHLLPDSLHILPIRLASGTHRIRVAFYDQFDEHVDGRDVTYDVATRSDGRDTLVWVSSQDQWPERSVVFP